MLRSMGLERVGHDRVTELNLNELIVKMPTQQVQGNCYQNLSGTFSYINRKKSYNSYENTKDSK